MPRLANLRRSLEKGAPNMEKIALNCKKEMIDFVSFYRRFTNVSGKQSFSTLYTARGGARTADARELLFRRRCLGARRGAAESTCVVRKVATRARRSVRARAQCLTRAGHQRARGPLHVVRAQVPGAGEAPEAPLPGVRGDREEHQEAPVNVFFSTAGGV